MAHLIQQVLSELRLYRRQQIAQFQMWPVQRRPRSGEPARSARKRVRKKHPGIVPAAGGFHLRHAHKDRCNLRRRRRLWQPVAVETVLFDVLPAVFQSI